MCTPVLLCARSMHVGALCAIVPAEIPQAVAAVLGSQPWGSMGLLANSWGCWKPKHPVWFFPGPEQAVGIQDVCECRRAIRTAHKEIKGRKNAKHPDNQRPNHPPSVGCSVSLSHCVPLHLCYSVAEIERYCFFCCLLVFGFFPLEISL